MSSLWWDTLEKLLWWNYHSMPYMDLFYNRWFVYTSPQPSYIPFSPSSYKNHLHHKFCQTLTELYFILQAHGTDLDGDSLTYGLTPIVYDESKPAKRLPFVINETTGVVYLNESLKGRVSRLQIMLMSPPSVSVSVVEFKLSPLLKNDSLTVNRKLIFGSRWLIYG